MGDYMKACMSKVLRKILDDPKLSQQLKELLANDDRDSLELLLQYHENTIYRIEMVGVHQEPAPKPHKSLLVRLKEFFV